MKTKQEQIKAIKQIIDERVETTIGQVQGRHGNVIKTVDTIIIAQDIVNAGYGDIRQAQIDMLNEVKKCSQCDNFFPDGNWHRYVLVSDIDILIEEVENEN